MKSQINIKTAEAEKISHLDYFNIAVSVDCVIFGYDENELKVLLIKSDLKEFEGQYSLLGDLVGPKEDLDAASYRVLKQRTGMDDVYLEQVRAFGHPSRHPSGRVVTIAYYSLVDIKHHKLRINHNDLHWHSINRIGNLAFDHNLILQTCLASLRQQVMENPVVFNLLPAKFTLRQLQQLYECILGIKLDRRNFRKKISAKDWLTDLHEMESNIPHRPGRLYSLKQKYLRNYQKGIRKFTL